MADTRYDEWHNYKLLNDRIFNNIKNHSFKNVVLVDRCSNYGLNLSRPLGQYLIKKLDQNFIDETTSNLNLHWSLKYTIKKFKGIDVNGF